MNASDASGCCWIDNRLGAKVKEELDKKDNPRRYSFTQAMYNWKPSQKRPEPRLGFGLVVLVVVVVVVVAYAIYRWR